MELEKQRKPTPLPQIKPTSPQKTYQAQPTTTLVPIRKNYSQEVCVIMGTCLLIMGLIGFVVDNLFGAHLSYTHNAIHFATGALALWFGFDNLKNAKIFSYIFGSIYGVLGALGFILGSYGMPSVGTIAEDQYLWKPIPEVLELGSVDHIIHILIAGVFLLGAVASIKKLQKI